VLAAACSSSNAASIPPPRYVEKSAAIAAGDNICTTLAADQQRLISDFNAKYPQATADEVHDFTINTLIPRIEQGVGDFHRIGEPTKDRLGWDVILGRLDVNLTWFKAMGPADLMTSLAASPFPSEWAKFNDYGFKVCGKPLA
jgi:hypothetical protein